MLSESIKIGDRVEIQQTRENDRPRKYLSQVENVLAIDRMVLHVPISYGQLVELSKEDEYRFVFFTEKGIFRFSGNIEDSKEENGFALMIIKIFGEGEKQQRRDFFRLDCILPMKFSKMERESMDAPDDAEVYQGIVKDVGGGGLCFLSNDNLEEEDITKLIIKLDDDVLVAIGEVLHKHYFPKAKYKYQYRVGFIGIRPGEQEKIVQFIFERQKRDLRKMGRTTGEATQT
ncbi:MAG: flagellar brake domain-containing protein [Defluviitaleaceae bacterium]|nr:flagellar brake domain-containing protein [Defluviitaleaceae bacterium]